MAFSRIRNAEIRGISACVPCRIIENSSLEIFPSEEDFKRFYATTGIRRRRVADAGTTSADLCLAAANRLLDALAWDREEIDCLIFVSQTPDYILPATACVLQERLGLEQSCAAFDISLGCSGWVYGLSVASSMVSSGGFRKALLLVGDTVTKTKSPQDPATFPLFGDAGTATALEFVAAAPDMYFDLHTDGVNAGAIMIRDGGFRHPFSADSLVAEKKPDGGIRNNLQSYLDGASVFSFGISKPPRSVRFLLEKSGVPAEEISAFFVHQANRMMNEKIRKKCGIPEEKYPYILENFGNTSSTSIPLSFVIGDKMGGGYSFGRKKFVGCGFGVGLSWGSVLFETENVCCPELLEI